jgi:hypothetical protein
MRSLLEAIRRNDLESVKDHIREGFDPTANKNEAIKWAASSGHLRIVKYLVELGCNPQTDYNYCLQYSAYYGYLDIVQYLKDIGCDSGNENYWALRYAIYHKRDIVAKYLIESGYNSPKLLFEMLLKCDDCQAFEIRTYILFLLGKKIMCKFLQQSFNPEVHFYSGLRISKSTRKMNLLKSILKPNSLHIQMTYFD